MEPKMQIQKLANIDAFENLQPQFKPTSISVFNGDFTSKLDSHMMDWLAEYSSSPDYASFIREAGHYLGNLARRSPSFASYSNREQQSYLMRECRDAAKSLNAADLVPFYIGEDDLLAFAFKSAFGSYFSNPD